MLPTINQRTKLVILTDDRELAITDSQYRSIKAEQSLGKYSDPITITDPDTKETLFDGKIGAIKEFRDIKSTGRVGDRYVCDYATKHAMNEECHCFDKYKVLAIEFRQTCWKLFQKIPIQLTESEIYKTIVSIKNHNQ